MPIHLIGMEGLFGVGLRGLLDSCHELSKVSVTLIKKINGEIQEKTRKLRKEREEFLHGNEKSETKCFDA